MRFELICSANDCDQLITWPVPFISYQKDLETFQTCLLLSPGNIHLLYTPRSHLLKRYLIQPFISPVNGPEFHFKQWVRCWAYKFERERFWPFWKGKLKINYHGWDNLQNRETHNLAKFFRVWVLMSATWPGLSNNKSTPVPSSVARGL